MLAIIIILRNLGETYSEPCQIAKTERFAKKVNDFQPLTIFERRFVLVV